MAERGNPVREKFVGSNDDGTAVPRQRLRAPSPCSARVDNCRDTVMSSLRSSREPTIGCEPLSGTWALSGRNFTVSRPMAPASIR